MVSGQWSVVSGQLKQEGPAEFAEPSFFLYFYLKDSRSTITQTHLHVSGKWMLLDWGGLAGYAQG